MGPVESQGHGVVATLLFILTPKFSGDIFTILWQYLVNKMTVETQFPKIVGKLITRKKLNPESDSTWMVIQKCLAFHLKKL